MARVGRKTVLGWISEDYKSNPQRFLCEVVGMISNLIASIILMWYSPNPPMFYAYIFFIIASILFYTGATLVDTSTLANAKMNDLPAMTYIFWGAASFLVFVGLQKK